ncbi:MAG: siderophore-interacting protein [Actinobacteria bacterium]|uniref:Unannotated protein n=1 Tax=freshwater metagenome TaxID=449393 RepID=A0A6J6NVU1_9ZZZZ|nr:siderophore-interacting protein [Actinomycetota bacterium]
MSKQIPAAPGRRPESAAVLALEVLRSQRVSPHFTRVTLGRGDIAGVVPRGFDQSLRLFIPPPGGSLAGVPTTTGLRSYLRYLALSRADRPLMRSYTVREHRVDGAHGPEIDLDLVVHELPDGRLAPAARWAETCAPGDAVAVLDQGIGFAPPSGLRRVALVADETGLPALAAILAGLAPDTQGHALIEVPSVADRREIVAPAGVGVTYVVRDDPRARPGVAVLAAAMGRPLPDEPFFGWVVGEQALASRLRRHWIAAGVPREHVAFCGYWRAR